MARWLEFLGAESELLIPLGGATGREMAGGIMAQGLRARVVPLREETRVNVVVTTEQGRQMRFNPPGPKVSGLEWREILRKTEEGLARGASLILSGALPRGVPTDAYAQLIRLAHRFGRRTFLDCDGAALVVATKAKPFFIKPNLHELSQWAGRSLRSEKTITAAAQALSRVTEGWVLVSLGQKGAMLVNQREDICARACPPPVRVLNTVGAGDAMLAGAALAIAQEKKAREWLRNGVAAGTAATECEAGNLPTRAAVAKLRKTIRVAEI